MGARNQSFFEFIFVKSMRLKILFCVFIFCALLTPCAENLLFLQKKYWHGRKRMRGGRQRGESKVTCAKYTNSGAPPKSLRVSSTMSPVQLQHRAPKPLAPSRASRSSGLRLQRGTALWNAYRAKPEVPTTKRS